MRDMQAFAVLIVACVLLLACGFAYGVAMSDEPQAYCAREPNPNAVLVLLPEDIE